MTTNYTSPDKTASVAFRPNGVYTGLVTRVDTSVRRVWVMIPRVASGFQFGPLSVATTLLPTVGDRVACMFVENRADDVIILGTVKSSSSPLYTASITCTSTTRPEEPAVGTQIYETDTGKTFIWNGSAWTGLNIDALLVDNNTLYVDAANNRVGVNNPSPTTALDVTGAITASGAVSAASVSATGAVSAASVSATGAVSAASVSATGAVSGASLSTAGAVSAGSVSATGAVSGGSLSTAGAVTAGSVSSTGEVSGGSLSTTGAASVGSLSSTGAASATRITLTQATGTAPMTISSTTLVANLNADLLDGQHATFWTPTGMLAPFAGASAPTGWLLCHGQSLVRADYLDLWNVIGYTYGGSGANFNVPDLRGRVIAGQDDMGGTSANRLTGQTGGVDGDVLGGTGGAETHTLTAAQLAAHSHSAGSYDGGNGINNALVTDGGGGNGYQALIASPGGATTRILTNSDNGGGSAHNNVQPTIILNYIIKT